MKSTSGIENWDDWPKDVVGLLRQWNHKSFQRLRFIYTSSKSATSIEHWFNRRSFICNICIEECQANRYGDAQLDGMMYCDDCLIQYARHVGQNLTDLT